MLGLLGRRVVLGVGSRVAPPFACCGPVLHCARCWMRRCLRLSLWFVRPPVGPMITTAFGSGVSCLVSLRLSISPSLLCLVSLLWVCILWGVGLEGVTTHTDGSGGHLGAFPLLRRCGFSVAVVECEGEPGPVCARMLLTPSWFSPVGPSLGAAFHPHCASQRC